MSSFRVRPRFKHLSPKSSDVLFGEFQSIISNNPKLTVTNTVTGHLTIKIPEAERHFWSPELNLTFEQTEEGTIVRGLYGPNPAVWAIFFFGYVFIGLLFTGLGMWGFVQHNLGLSSDVLWSLPFLAAAALALYMVAQFGQKIGAEQMYRLHYFYEEAIGDRVSIS